MMKPRIEIIAEKILIGKKIHMNFMQDRTAELWRSFMPHRHEIQNKVNGDFISMQIFSALANFTNFDPHIEFDKWAAVEVSSIAEIPEQMETIQIPTGLYAVFTHYGPAIFAEKTFRYIFATWLPSSGYMIDHRPHFAVMGEKYKPDSEQSEEEIFIPVKKK